MDWIIEFCKSIIEFSKSNFAKLLELDAEFLPVLLIALVAFYFTIQYLISKRRRFSSSNILLATLFALLGWLVHRRKQTDQVIL